MKIKARFHGVLGTWITEETISFDLKSDSTYADLLKEIGNRYSPTMPPQLWDEDACDFRGSILAIGDGESLKSPDTTLIEDEEITFYLMLSGG
jgi:hypothetical protein